MFVLYVISGLNGWVAIQEYTFDGKIFTEENPVQAHNSNSLMVEANLKAN